IVLIMWRLDRHLLLAAFSVFASWLRSCLAAGVDLSSILSRGTTGVASCVLTVTVAPAFEHGTNGTHAHSFWRLLRATTHELSSRQLRSSAVKSRLRGPSARNIRTKITGVFFCFVPPIGESQGHCEWSPFELPRCGGNSATGERRCGSRPPPKVLSRALCRA